MDKNNKSNDSSGKDRKPLLLGVHSYPPKAMSADERQKFKDGPLALASAAADSFPREVIHEAEWV